MKSYRIIGYAFVVALLAVATPSFADVVVLEAPQALETCDHVHAIDGASKCTTYHFTKTDKPAPENPQAVSVGTAIELDGVPYVVDWIGTGYYTASGKILHLGGNSGGSTIELIELLPGLDSIHQADWQDVDGNGELSKADLISVGGRSELIIDTRLNLRVTLAR
jgi:hypothetical protein